MLYDFFRTGLAVLLQDRLSGDRLAGAECPLLLFWLTCMIISDEAHQCLVLHHFDQRGSAFSTNRYIDHMEVVVVDLPARCASVMARLISSAHDDRREDILLTHDGTAAGRHPHRTAWRTRSRRGCQQADDIRKSVRTMGGIRLQAARGDGFGLPVGRIGRVAGKGF